MNESVNQPKKKWWKAPLGPALLSALVAPGTGQIVNGDYKKGAAVFIAFFGLLVWFSRIVTEQLSLALTGTPEQWYANPDVLQGAILKLVNGHTDVFITFYLLVLLLWGFSVIDAYLIAKQRRLNLPPPIDDEDSNALS